MGGLTGGVEDGTPGDGTPGDDTPEDDTPEDDTPEDDPVTGLPIDTVTGSTFNTEGAFKVGNVGGVTPLLGTCAAGTATVDNADCAADVILAREGTVGVGSPGNGGNGVPPASFSAASAF